MADKENSTSDVSKTPPSAPKASPVKAETPSKTPPVQVKPGEKPAVNPEETTKNPEKKDANHETTPDASKGKETSSDITKEKIKIQNEAIIAEKKRLLDKKRTAQEIQDGTKVYSEDFFSMNGFDGAGVVPPRPDQKMVKKEDYERSQKELQEQENKTAKAIEGKMNAELESVTKNGNLDQLAPDAQKKIRGEVVRTSIDPQRLPDEKKKEILSTMKGADGQPMFDMSLVDLNNLTPSQKEYILKSDTVKKMSSEAVDEYKKLQEEAQKIGKKPDPELIKKLQLQLGLPGPDALELSQIRPGIQTTDYPANTQIGIVQRILAESTFSELCDTLKDGMKWSHVPERVKREVMIESFPAESDKNSSDIQQAIIEAKAMVASPEYAKKEGESSAQFETRFKEKTGVAASNLAALALEARKSGLSPQMRALADFFGPIGAFFGIPFWKEYMGENLGQDEMAETSERYMTKDGNNEYKGEVGIQSPELAQNGFKGDVMNSIWRWEYQAGHNVEVVPAGVSGLTLCGGIDLAYTPYANVQTIFKGILKDETIAKLQPFCNNGRRGPIRGQAVNLLRAKAGLKEEINGQFNYQNMGEAFTRSLAIDWQRLVNKHGSVVKNAPGYIQVFMLSRFYHAGIGGSSNIIKKIIAAGFDHSAVVSIAESFRNTRAETYYRNRMGKEIAYLKSRPGDAVASVAKPQENRNGVELSKNNAVRWFQEHSGDTYGEGKGQYDCMTSTHAALGLNYTKDHAGAFNGKFIDKKDKKNNLWNVAMASALYVGNLTSANSDAKDGIIEKQPNGYYGEKSGDTTNMEYYIEENVMKRVNDTPDGIVNVRTNNDNTLIHYSKSRKGVQGIIDDIKNRLKPGESAMMGATGEGTNKKGHEWLVYNDNGTLKAYDATNAGGQGVSGTGMELSSFLNDSRRAQYTNEAIIFAKRPQAAPVSQNLANAPSAPRMEGARIDVFKTPGRVAFIGDSHFEETLRGKVSQPITVLSGGNMMGGNKLSVYDRVNSPAGRNYLGDKENIVICLGTNDGETKLTPEGMVGKMQNLVNLVRSINPNCKILIVTPPYNGNPKLDKKIGDYSEYLVKSGLVGSGITVADFYTESKKRPLTLADGTHLRNYEPMRQIINDKIGVNQVLLASR